MKRDISTYLKHYRQLAGLSQAELAEQIGISAPSYNAFERNKAHPKLDTLLKISELLNVSLDELTGNKADPVKRIATALEGVANFENTDNGLVCVTFKPPLNNEPISVTLSPALLINIFDTCFYDRDTIKTIFISKLAGLFIAGVTDILKEQDLDVVLKD